MKQLQRINVTAKQCQHKQSKKGAKFMHKIHKIAIFVRHFTRAPWSSDAAHKTV